MAAVSKGAFGRPAAPKLHRFALPECGVEAYTVARELSAKDLIELRKQGETGDTDNQTFVYSVLALTISDDAGNLLFDGPDDVRDNFGLSIATLRQLTENVIKASGLDAREKN